MSALRQLSTSSPQSSAKKAESSKRGFTLIELMIAISIIAIISAVGLISYSQAQKIGRDARRKQDLRQIAVALELFYQKNKRYPCSGTGAVTLPAAWQASNATLSWLTDNSLSCGWGGSNQIITPLYINKMPIDPLSNDGIPAGATGYGYAYYSSDSQYSASCPKGQYYILITKLENSSDKERLGSESIIFCGTTLSTTSAPLAFNANQFIITGP